MKPVKCESCKKFFDADKYSNCPHCNVGGVDTNFFPNSKAKEEKQDLPVSEANEGKGGKFFSRLSTGRTAISKSGNETNDNASVSQTGTGITTPSESKEVSDIPRSISPDFEDIYSDSTITAESIENNSEPSASSTVSIYEAVKNATAVQSTADQKTIAFYNFSNDIEPVVGWLVCTKGVYRGASFNLKTGRNNIGRALTMDVALAQEKSVSRERHASIMFEPHQKKFFVQSGEGNGLTYVNKELLMMFKELQPYDVISLGACELMFVPLCGENFDWED